MPDGTGIICRSFSPQNSYLTALNFSEEQLVIFDTSLNIVGTFDSIGCPTWGDNDDLIYYSGRASDNSHDYVYVYSIEKGSVLRTFDVPYVNSELVISPDGLHIAFTGYVGGYKVNIIYSDNSVQLLTDEFDYSGDPLWRPVSD